jgi:hypothetical protein
MGTYEWTQKVISNVYPLGNEPGWWTLAGDPHQAITCASPNGDGDILVRTEFFASASASVLGDGLGVEPFQFHAISILFLGEVYPDSAGGFPDPHLDGPSSGVISAVASVTALADPDPTASPTVVTYSTRGYVTSKGQRGPRKYGGGHPQIRIGMFGMNLFDEFILGATNSSETYAVRTLWYTP